MRYSRPSPPRSGRVPHRAGVRSRPCRRGPAAGDRNLARLRDYPHVKNRLQAWHRSIDRYRVEIDAWMTTRHRLVEPLHEVVLRNGHHREKMSTRLDSIRALTRACESSSCRTNLSWWTYSSTYQPTTDHR